MTLRHVLGGNNLGYQGQAPASFLDSGAKHQAQPTTASDTADRVSRTYGRSPTGTMEFLDDGVQGLATVGQPGQKRQGVTDEAAGDGA